MGRPTRQLCTCVHRPPRSRVCACSESRWAVSSNNRSAVFPIDQMRKGSLSTGEDLAINLWDLGSGKRIKKMIGHNASIYSLAFSAESSLLVSGGADWTVRCWDVKSAGGTGNDKPKENGIFGTQENGITDYGEDEATETYVSQFLIGISSLTADHRIDLLATFPTKRTPVIDVQFTPRNLCLVGGVYQAPETR